MWERRFLRLMFHSLFILKKNANENEVCKIQRVSFWECKYAVFIEFEKKNIEIEKPNFEVLFVDVKRKKKYEWNIIIQHYNQFSEIRFCFLGKATFIEDIFFRKYIVTLVI